MRKGFSFLSTGFPPLPAHMSHGAVTVKALDVGSGPQLTVGRAPSSLPEGSFPLLENGALEP